jgi:hypothetical protein
MKGKNFSSEQRPTENKQKKKRKAQKVQKKMFFQGKEKNEM